MYIVVRNMQTQKKDNPDDALIEKKPFNGEYKIGKGDTIKMGRLKFSVKDYRSDSHPAYFDIDDSSPVKKSADYAADEVFAEEEEVEIECGVADSKDIQCKVCWGDD